MRQPQARNASSGRPAKRPRIKVASTAPVGPPVTAMEAAKPRFFSLTCSAAIKVAPAHSPPTARPWMTRSRTRSSGAAMPMVWYVGIRPMRPRPGPSSSG